MPQECQKLPGQQRVFWEVFHNQLALLLTGFLKHNMAAMEAQQNYMLPALTYLVRITAGPNEETFKICVEFWQTFSARLFVEYQQRRAQAPAAASPLLLDVTSSVATAADKAADDPRVKPYNPILSEVRRVLISKMAKPPEVTIKENEEGHIVRQEEEDTDEIALYKMMREALIYLTHLNAQNMEEIMVERLTQECLGNEGSSDHWSPTLLNRLCWAIGSISGAMQEVDEKRFLVAVIRDLLSLCEMKRGKENKAVVASNIMYVVGQYPRFLKAHWKFLKTVIFKLFEFMHETFPGVQEMAVDTFLKICQKCKKKFVGLQSGELSPFVEELMGHIAQDINELDHLHVCTYFEAVGSMISAAAPEAKERLVASLMMLFNQKWAQILRSMSQDQNASLQNQQLIREVSLVLRVNERVVSAVGTACQAQLGHIYMDMLKIYKFYSDFISHSIAQQGMSVMNFAHVRLMRNVKRDTLRLVQTFVDRATSEQAGDQAIVVQVAQRFVPPLLEPVLADYRSNLPQARDAEVLDLLAMLATKMSDAIAQEVPKIFEMVFECTLDMIKGDFQSYPDHRNKFYDLLKAINTHCFQSLFFLPEAQLRLYVDSLVWAVKHEHPAVADSGLKVLSEFIERLLRGPSQYYNPFFKQYYWSLLQDILSVLTDTLHKAGFKLQQHILLQMLNAVESDMLEFVTKQQTMEFLFNLLQTSFQTLHRVQIETFCLNCFNKCRQPAEFQQHIRDFLILLKEWGGLEDALYDGERQEAQKMATEKDNLKRMQVPGLIPQYDPIRMNMEANMDDI
eukprot:gnl/MRDRNA2_/MRDRNA2_152589_c0_seq1.p1 gnl/MRDRNA2_/MRDRNA2_152589_c0~~gnl/MRDRNA2_/MRDRNA2_152589_c0_seq1.p1  ORF type:complete len:806 (+),score=199.18 gnl/MRDRNA2_/MRDRNA2_152589_c0_seq1:37-2418(+)